MTKNPRTPARLRPNEQHLAEMIPPEGKLGPAMLALSERHRVFVMACVSQGTKINHVQAARTAGYQCNAAAIKVQAHRLAHDEQIQAALLEEARRKMQSGTVAATALLLEIIGDTRADRKDRIRAAGMILDRGGMPMATEHQVTVTHNESRAEKVLRVIELAKALGHDPREMLGSLIDVSEADYAILESRELAHSNA